MRSTTHGTEAKGYNHRRYASRLGESVVALALFTLMLVGVPASIASASPVSFHTMCKYAKMAPDDPIVYPNQPGASHLHDFFGNTTTNASSTLSSLLHGGTTCDVTADTAAYWFPALISSSGQVVVPTRVSAYYLQGYLQPNERVTAFPAGLKIVAGGDTHDLLIAGYSCSEGMPQSSVPLNCGNGSLRAVVAFPSCWDGRNTNSPDNRRHMAYPKGTGCPSGFPVRVPKLVLHVRYPISNGQGYRLSSDARLITSNGMSLHADYFNAWNQNALNALVQSCLNGSGSGCPN